ncbi:hypothetical protein J437_LFUL004255 [Ladona fulva]|uniref:MADF domain-containing protein n=1 Tax=Ladona fulva TaxID=123851 RepID=A0A8K0KD59_LADFU|nr:hypothetical protein J437_LFUL004255 [Ladona fulva]
MASEQTLAFIEDYKSYRALWDHKDKYYTNKSKRMEAYLVLAAKYQLTVKGVKNKIKSLRSYFSKEHQKVMEKTLSGEDSESNWFAYKPLLFISDSPMAHKDYVISEGGSWTEEVSDVDAKILRTESADVSTIHYSRLAENFKLTTF